MGWWKWGKNQIDFGRTNYCSGLTVPSQVEIDAALERTTASANEQK
jgi:hypothetical protein